MPSNIEIKARVHNRALLKQRAAQLSASEGQLILQEDHFFKVPKGRLKLRILNGCEAQLIAYQRSDQKGPKQSRYSITPIPDPATLRETLGAVLPITGVVTKRRLLFLVGQTRIHLDQVAELGDFIELEVVMKQGQALAEGEQIARKLMEDLGIETEDLVEAAYIDLLEAC